MRTEPYMMLIVLLFCACGEERSTAQNDSTKAQQHDDVAALSQSTQAQDLKEYSLTDSIVADFDGDSSDDIVRFGGDGTIEITYGASNETDVISCVAPEGQTIPDFSWATNWGIHTDETINYTYSKDGELFDGEYKLDHPAIVLWQEGGGIGFLTFKEGKFVWMTSGC